MKVINKLAVISFGLLLASNCFAGWQSGKIAVINVRASDGLHWVVLEGQPQGRPACASVQIYWIIKDENSVAGKSQISLLLAAQAAGKPVSITGLGTCTRWGDGEDINVVAVQ
jgi:hypothetical protein